MSGKVIAMRLVIAAKTGSIANAPGVKWDANHLLYCVGQVLIEHAIHAATKHTVHLCVVAADCLSVFDACRIFGRDTSCSG